MNTILVVQELTFPSQSSLPRTFTPFITMPVRQGVKTVMHTQNLGQNSALYPTVLVSIGKSQPSACTNTNTHADTFYMPGEVMWL